MYREATTLPAAFFFPPGDAGCLAVPEGAVPEVAVSGVGMAEVAVSGVAVPELAVAEVAMAELAVAVVRDVVSGVPAASKEWVPFSEDSSGVAATPESELDAAPTCSSPFAELSGSLATA